MVATYLVHNPIIWEQGLDARSGENPRMPNGVTGVSHVVRDVVLLHTLTEGPYTGRNAGTDSCCRGVGVMCRMSSAGRIRNAAF